jgi:hypothetical protein
VNPESANCYLGLSEQINAQLLRPVGILLVFDPVHIGLRRALSDRYVRDEQQAHSLRSATHLVCGSPSTAFAARRRISVFNQLPLFETNSDVAHAGFPTARSVDISGQLSRRSRAVTIRADPRPSAYSTIINHATCGIPCDLRHWLRGFSAISAAVDQGQFFFLNFRAGSLVAMSETDKSTRARLQVQNSTGQSDPATTVNHG